MPQDPEPHHSPSTSNRHEGQAEHLVQAGQVSGGITINAADSRRRRGPWGVIGAVAATLLIAYLLALAIGQPPGPENPPTSAPGNPPPEKPLPGQKQLRSLESGLCLASTAGGYGVAQLPCTQNSAQFWTAENVGPGSLTTFSRTRGKEDTKICLELPGVDSQPADTEVQVAHCNTNRGADNQLWQVENGDKPDTFRIRNDRSEQRCLAPGGTQPGASLVIKDCAAGRGSQWAITTS